jgi:hypothetical protein
MERQSSKKNVQEGGMLHGWQTECRAPKGHLRQQTNQQKMRQSPSTWGLQQ